MIVYIINVCVTRKNIYDRSHRGYFMGCATTTEDIIYWNPDQTFVIHRSHNIWFNEYNYCLSIEDKHTTSSLLIQQDPENIIHN